MEAVGLEKTGTYVCKYCKYRFKCFTTRDEVLNGLCNIDEFIKLDYETVRQIHIEKAKRLGHYYPTVKAE